MTSHVRLKTIAIINEVLEVSLSQHEDGKRSDIENWDSLKHMELILRLEEEFQMRFSIAQVGAIESVNDIIDYIEEVDNGSQHRS